MKCREKRELDYFYTDKNNPNIIKEMIEMLNKYSYTKYKLYKIDEEKDRAEFIPEKVNKDKVFWTDIECFYFDMYYVYCIDDFFAQDAWCCHTKKEFEEEFEVIE